MQIVVECHFNGVRKLNGSITFRIPRGLQLKYFTEVDGVGQLVDAGDQPIEQESELLLLDP